MNKYSYKIHVLFLSAIFCSFLTGCWTERKFEPMKNVDWNRVHERIISRYDQKEQEEMEQLVAWVVEEVKNQIKSGKGIIKLTDRQRRILKMKIKKKYSNKKPEKFEELLDWVIEEVNHQKAGKKPKLTPKK